MSTRNLDTSDSDDDIPLSKKVKPKQLSQELDYESSSDSDIGNYLHRADTIDLNSSFFNTKYHQQQQTSSGQGSSFNQGDEDTFAGVSKFTDCEPNDDSPLQVTVSTSSSKPHFQQLHEYVKKLEEIKRHVEKYNAKNEIENKLVNVSTLLAAGEAKGFKEDREVLETAYDSSEFETCSDSEKEDWEEVEEKQEIQVVPREGLQITVEMPGVIQKKKSVDLLMAIKRRINRVRKENQVLVHKVHLLCWLAHGNYVSSSINSQNVLAVALSLLPSQQCYPPNRTDLSYLEQIVKWYNSAVSSTDQPDQANSSLVEALEQQICKKSALNKKMLVYIFVAIIRSLGIQCRLVLSLQVEPLRPPNSDLHSLSTKQQTASVKSRAKSVGELSKLKKPEVKPRSKSITTEPSHEKKINPEAKLVSKITKSKEESKPQRTQPLEVSKHEGKPISETHGNKKEARSAKSVGELSKLTKKEGKTRTKCTITEAEVKKTNVEETKSVSKVAKSKEDAKSQRKQPYEKVSKLENESRRATNRNKEEVLPIDGKSDIKKASDKTKEDSKGETSKKKGRTVEIKTEPKSARTAGSAGQDQPPKGVKRKSKKVDGENIPQLDGANDTDKTHKPNLKKLKQQEPPCPIREHPKRLKASIKYRDTDSEDDFTAETAKNASPFRNGGVNLKKLRAVDVRKDIVNLVKGSIKQQKQLDRSKMVQKRRSVPHCDEDSDYAPEEVKKKRESEDEFAPKVKVKRRVPSRKEAEEAAKNPKRQGIDVWAEVFLEAEEKWISVDAVKGQFHCVNELYTRATHPVSYIVAWNNDNSLKDITRRYCQNFNTVTRKLRIDAKWWQECLKSFIGKKTAMDREEDEELERQQLDKPLPTSITEYKNHPLYVLKRHLLKFEALYPPDAPTLGFVRKEPVYSRQCVYTLHSRDIWLKHAKTVKPGEQPYKIVKARPRWDKLSNAVVTGEMLEIFGPWQTQDYEPPTAENGVVPRNAFGNVELFKPCMLPKKTVHLQLPGLNKVARRMNIDCAPALVGFDFHAGWNHPSYDGFVVCEEHADVLVAAWELEQDELSKKEEEKIEKRVYGNWKKLIKGLLIRERLKAKYDFGEASGGTKKTKGAPKLVTRKRRIESDDSEGD